MSILRCAVCGIEHSHWMPCDAARRISTAAAADAARPLDDAERAELNRLRARYAAEQAH